MGTNPSSTETVTIFGNGVPIRHERRSIDTLRLNPDNPRLRHELLLGGQKLRSANPLTEPEIEQLLWDQDRTKKLYWSVLRSGGIQNSLWIRDSGSTEEGNRRVVVGRRIKANLLAGKLKGQEATFAQTIIDNIPVNVLPDNVTDKEIDVLLAREHIAGKYPWDAVDQAEHLYRMNNEDGMSHDEIALIVERSRPWVIQKITAFEWTREYLTNNAKGDKLDYSFFEELYKVKASLRKNATFDTNDSRDMQYFQSLIRDNKITAAIQVRDLPDILADSDAKTTLENNGYQAAWIYVQTRNPAVSSPTFQAISDATAALQRIPLNEYQSIPSDAAKKKLVQQLYGELDKLKKNLNI